ncbi:cytochrome-c peroxidase [Flexithrix dorotheae]|uniref:cytochrome-c peroxidase n=1 Tax=Flexithrix dorotheae TaxID=70993 RepID=UPI000367FE0D|nr:cytochrome c peroxidase [Flexithrix dorotheae]
MRTFQFSLLTILIFTGTFYLSSFTQTDDSDQTPVAIISNRYYADLEKFKSETEQLNQIAGLFSTDSSHLSDLRDQLILTRQRFKQIEFLAEKLDPEFVKDYINGPPLKSLERNSPSLSILEPEGLQVLEEIIFSDEAFEEKVRLKNLTSSLEKNAGILEKYNRKYLITDRLIFEAVRFEIIRIFTLGLSGFDSPETSLAINEVETALNSCEKALKTYHPLIASKAPELPEKLSQKFSGARAYLNQNNTFESFDRLHFLKIYLNPLFALVLEAHRKLGIETYYETSNLNLEHSVNYNANSIFANDFLNPFYYSLLRKKDYTPEIIDLGKTLFFDPILSNTNERACASCHQPELAFTDGMKKSTATGFEGTVKRNSPTLINAVYADRYFYDFRTDVLENQIEHVITSHQEFQTDFIRLIEKLSQSEEYKAKFNEAFPQQELEGIQKHTISQALAAYVISLSGFNSPFDQYVRGEISELDPAVKNGFNLFMGKAACGTCHFAPVFNGTVPPKYHESETEVLGVPADTSTTHTQIDPDMGRYNGVLKERASIFEHSFKTPTVRNIALTAPYMHNGVYETLEEVVDFYNNGGGIGLGLDVPNQTLPEDELGLSDKEKAELVAFMNALSDTTNMTTIPQVLPKFPENLKLNDRVIGGEY